MPARICTSHACTVIHCVLLDKSTYLRSMKYSGVQPSTYVHTYGFPAIQLCYLWYCYLLLRTTCSMYVCALLLRYSYVVYVRECYGTCIYSTNGIAPVRRYVLVCTLPTISMYVLLRTYVHTYTPLPTYCHATYWYT